MYVLGKLEPSAILLIAPETKRVAKRLEMARRAV